MNKKYKLLIIGFILTVTASLYFILRPEEIERKNKETKIVTPKTITILPLGNNLSDAFIRTVYTDIKKFLPAVEVVAAKPLPAHAYNKERGRYRADSLIHWMSRKANPDQIFISITDVDISTTKDGKPDWGVMGLGFQPGKAAIASNFRMKNKDQFWKVAIHELGHTSGLPHCPIKSCFMRDAEGGNPTAEEKEFCNKCRSTLIKEGWRL
jgi:archaemetzincin